MAHDDEQRPPGGAPQLHQHREIAESFGTDADRYDRARPRYPKEMIDALVKASPGPDVLDVGTGTGIAARQLAQAGCTVLGVEVDPRMAEVARRSGIEVEVGTFESWQAAGRDFDLVAAGQSWHWIDPVAGAAKAATVLRPRGRLAAFWNVFEPTPELQEAFAEVYRRVSPSLPFNPWARSTMDGQSAIVATAIEGLEACGAFDAPELWRFGWDHRYSRDAWLEQLATFGGHATLRSDELAALCAGIGDVIDGGGGSLVMGYVTVVLTAARTA